MPTVMHTAYARLMHVLTPGAQSRVGDSDQARACLRARENEPAQSGLRAPRPVVQFKAQNQFFSLAGMTWLPLCPCMPSGAMTLANCC